jgi:hypothetical protein
MEQCPSHWFEPYPEADHEESDQDHWQKEGKPDS